MRERIDVSEIEATTKIRAKYLRALENEEWDLLPGPTFVKSFLRTYADTLGLDGKALVEEYRLHYEHPNEPPEPIVSSPRAPARAPRGPSTGSGGPSRGYIALVGVVAIVIVLLVVGLLSGGGSSKNQSTQTGAGAAGAHRRLGGGRTGARTGAGSPAASVISLQLRATGTVYVCLIDDTGRKLIAGRTLEAGYSTPTYRSKRFELTLGNNSVALTIDGIPRVIPASSEAIGYTITKAGRRTLAPGHLPTCT